MRICPKCGQQLGEDAVFCVNCGTNINDYANTPDSVEDISASAEKIIALATELSEKYKNGMSAMDVSVTIAKEKAQTDINELKALLQRESDKVKMLERDLDDAKLAVRSLKDENAALKAQIQSVQMSAQENIQETSAPQTSQAIPREQPFAPAATAMPQEQSFAPAASVNNNTDDEATVREPSFTPQSQDIPRFCPNCGTPITADMFFCNECGCRLK